MKREHTRRQTIGASLALLLGLVFALSLVGGTALAEGHRERGQTLPPSGDPPPQLEIKTFWLILDTARPVEETLPPLLKTLTALQGSGGVLGFDETPQASAPSAAPGLQVTALPRAWARMRYLPGVLDVSPTLPPPPPGTDSVGTLYHSTATVAGRVTQAGTGLGIMSVHVDIYDAVSYAHIGSDTTDLFGDYQVIVTAPFDQAKVRFDDGLSPLHTYVTEWYNDKYYFSTADAVDLSGGGMVGNINAFLDKVGLIKGTILYDSSFAPASGVMVDVYGTNGSYAGYVDSSPSGQYAVTLRSGTYNLRFGFDEDTAPEWYQDRDSQAAADVVTVSAGQTTTVNAMVAAAGHITGVVTDESTGLPSPVWPATLVLVYDESGAFADDSELADPSGAYQIGALGTGNYTVRFYSYFPGFYAEEYYNDKTAWEQADPVAVTAGSTTPNINAALTPLVAGFGTVTGTITRLGGNPLGSGDSVRLHFYDAGSDALVYDARLYGNNVWTVYEAVLPAGTYKVLFAPYGGNYSPKWYNDKTSLASADVVNVNTGMTTTDVSADLELGLGCITGTVTAAVDGSKLANVEVRAYAAYAENYISALTDADGEYALCFFNGGFHVQFVRNPYVPEWYSGVPARTEATLVTVPVLGIARADATLDMGGCISGRVTDMRGLWLGGPSGYLRLYDSAGNRVEFYQAGDTLGTGEPPLNDGSFVLCGLPSGNYVVRCWSEFDGRLSGQVPVSVTAGQETSGVTCVVALHMYLPLVMKNHQ